MIRSFVAVSLPPEVRRALKEIAAPFKRLGLDARFASPDSMHLTLKFLGDIEPGRVDSLAAQISGAASVHAPFRLTLGTLGVFPNRRRPKVLWRGLRGIAPLVDLQRGIASLLAQEGFEPEKRPYAPHLTLARLRSPRGLQAMLDQIDHFNERYHESQGEDFEVTQVHLYQSILKPAGAVHKILASAHLENSP